MFGSEKTEICNIYNITIHGILTDETNQKASVALEWCPEILSLCQGPP